MNWDDARFCDMLAYQAVIDDAPRGSDRAKIANCANGLPPYTAEEVAENQIEVNVNFLEMTKSLQEARLQFSNAFLKQGNFFRCATDMGSPNKRQEYSATVTTSINRILKRSIQYFESYRAKGGLVCLHGIAPVVKFTEPYHARKMTCRGSAPTMTELSAKELTIWPGLQNWRTSYT